MEREKKLCETGKALWNVFEKACDEEEPIGDAYLKCAVHVYCCPICGMGDP